MSHKKFGPDRFSRFDVYWIQTDRQTDRQTDKQTNRQAKFIYRFTFKKFKTKTKARLDTLFDMSCLENNVI